VSAASTLLAFGLLAASSIPALHAIGSTVLVGVIAQFTFSLLLARETRPPASFDGASSLAIDV
jgi:predicted exporter